MGVNEIWDTDPLESTVAIVGDVVGAVGKDVSDEGDRDPAEGLVENCKVGSEVGKVVVEMTVGLFVEVGEREGFADIDGSGDGRGDNGGDGRGDNGEKADVEATEGMKETVEGLTDAAVGVIESRRGNTTPLATTE